MLGKFLPMIGAINEFGSPACIDQSSDANSSAYIHLRKENGWVRQSGQATCTLGHKVASGCGVEGEEGVFAEWAWDGRTLNVKNDRLGFHPLYYYCVAGEIAVSPSLVQLLRIGAPRELDETALAVMVRFGQFLGEDTPFTAIRAAPPNATFIWYDGHLTVEGYRTQPKEQALSRKNAVEAYIEAFRDAMRRRPPKGTCALPLSGGRDSRLILLELARSGHPPDLCMTRPRLSNNDEDIARKLTAAAGVPLRILPFGRMTFEEHEHKLHRTNFCSLEHDTIWQVRKCLPDTVETIYDGLGGDTPSTTEVFQTPERLKLFRAGRLEELCDGIIGRSDAVTKFLTREAAQRFGYERAKSRFLNELSFHENTPNPVASFFFWNRTRRNLALAPYAVFGHVPQVYSPFLDADVLSLVMSLPAENQLDFHFRDDVISTAFPEYQHVPFASKVEARPSNYRDLVELGRSVLLAVLRRRTLGHFEPTATLPRLCALASGISHNTRHHWYMDRLIYSINLESVEHL